MDQYREGSRQNASSAERLREYLQVTSPRLWMLLTAVIALLAGVIVLACTATIENTMELQVTVRYYADGEERTPDIPEGEFTSVTAVQPLSMKDTLEPGMKLRVAGEEGELAYMYNTTEGELGLAFDMEKEKLGIPDGEYDAELVLESVTPISFLLN